MERGGEDWEDDRRAVDGEQGSRILGGVEGEQSNVDSGSGSRSSRSSNGGDGGGKQELHLQAGKRDYGGTLGKPGIQEIELGQVASRYGKHRVLR